MAQIRMITVPRTAKCTAGPSAVTGERCGEPAVTGFIGTDGRHYYECAAHDSRTNDRGGVMAVAVTAEQVEALREAIADHADGEEMVITSQGDGTLIVGFSLATVQIATDGETEEI